MTSTKKLLIPILLGVIAAAINAYLLSENLTTKTFLMVKSEAIKQGDNFSKTNLTPLELPNNFQGSVEALVPYDKVDLVDGQPAQRSYIPGDVVFWRDVTPPSPIPQFELNAGEELVQISLVDIAYEPELLAVGNQVSFVRQDAVNPGQEVPAGVSGGGDISLIGPFRIVSVGSKVEVDVAKDENGRGTNRTEVRTIGLAIASNLDAMSKQLLSASGRQTEGSYRITHLVLHRSADATGQRPVREAPLTHTGSTTAARP